MSVGVIVAIAVVVIIVLWGVIGYNSLVKGKNKCEEAFSTMDVYLKQRFDLIPNLVSTVKGYAKHEAETLENVIQARQGMSSMTIEERIQQERSISDVMSRINLVAEQYPDLRASQNFSELQNELSRLEADIANARKYYNGCVRQFNDKVMTIPTNIIAGIGGFQKLPSYEVDNVQERSNVKVEF